MQKKITDSSDVNEISKISQIWKNTNFKLP